MSFEQVNYSYDGDNVDVSHEAKVEEFFGEKKVCASNDSLLAFVRETTAKHFPPKKLLTSLRRLQLSHSKATADLSKNFFQLASV